MTKPFRRDNPKNEGVPPESGDGDVISWLLACTPTAAPGSDTVADAPRPAVLLTLELPAEATPSAALQIASLEATLGEVEGVVVEVRGERTPAHRFSPTVEVARATVQTPLSLRVCTPECHEHAGSIRAIAIATARQLDRTFDPDRVWRLPVDGAPATPHMQTAARVHYGFVKGLQGKRMGSSRDAVAQGPREDGATALAGWMQGRRDLSLDRSRLGAEILDQTARLRDTDRSRFDAAMGYLDAGWTEESWERVREAEPDLRTWAAVGWITLANRRVDLARTALVQLPPHPQRARLHHEIDHDNDSLRSWLQAWPDDPLAKQAATAWEHEHGDSARAAARRELDRWLEEAEVLARRTAASQNRFGAALAQGPLPCGHEAWKEVDQAGSLGEAHRVAVETARTAHRELQHADPALDVRLARQLRAAVVLRAYQQRVLLGRSCVAL